VATEDIPVAALKDGGWREWARIDAALAAGEIDERGWHDAVAEVIKRHYLAATTPWQQSGRSGDWEGGRRWILSAVDADGDLLDIGCANGYLMETLHAWAAEDGVRLEPYGLDIIPELADLARRRLPHWARRIWVGNALHWVPPRRFDYVRVGLEYVPAHRRGDLVGHLMAHAVGRRLIVGPYNEEVGERALEEEMAGQGFRIEGRRDQEHPDPRVMRRLFWICH
jgi:SAM-dependent methyltransferase